MQQFRLAYVPAGMVCVGTGARRGSRLGWSTRTKEGPKSFCEWRAV